MQNCEARRNTLPFWGLVAQFYANVPRENFPAMEGNYLAEIEKMRAEATAYLCCHASEPAPAEAA
jgi:hypothetical protein